MDYEQASNDYLAIEKSLVDVPGSEAVLVRVESVAALKRAYPNYFMDTGLFLKEVRESIAGKPRRRPRKSQPPDRE
jgi:hypothetical protein